MMRVITFLALAGLISCGNAIEQKNNTAENNSAQTATTSSPQNIFSEINPGDFNEKMKSNPGTILDVRTPEEVAEGYILGAVFINFYDADFSSKVDALDKTKPVYVYCRSGARSGKAAQILKEKNFSEIYNLKGGFMAWQSEGKEISK